MERITFGATAKVEGNTLSGVAHTFGQRTLRGNRYIEFAPTAFDMALGRSDVRAFVNHDTTLILGRQSNGTVRVSVADGGLAYEIDLPDTSYAADLKAVIARGDLNQMSFGVFPGKFTLSKAEDGRQVVTHTSVNDLFDISPVSLPAFEGTSAALHSLSIDGESVASQVVKARHRALTA